MPCNSDYLELSERERAQRKAAKLLIYVCEKFDLPVPRKAIRAAVNQWGRPDCIPDLCKILTNLSSQKKLKPLFRSNTIMSHELAIFWLDHRHADKQRESLEKLKKKNERLRKSGLAKLTKAEKRVLCVSFAQDAEDE